VSFQQYQGLSILSLPGRQKIFPLKCKNPNISGNILGVFQAYSKG